MKAFLSVCTLITVLAVLVTGCAQKRTPSGPSASGGETQPSTAAPSRGAATGQPELVDYSNEEHGFALQLPKDWEISEKGGMSVATLSPQEGSGDAMRESISVATYNLSSGLTLDNFYQTRKKAAYPEYKELEVKDVTLAGEKAKHAVYTYKDGSKGTLKESSYFIAKGKKAYVITYKAQPDTFDKFLATFEQVVPTFKPA